ncbi:diguanylate cyclase (GGDEF)-like protein [Lysinibacillus composti]|nr:diguanylate cyclase (GGDEF)-like protein [Lysinibacillus composti]
MMENEGKVNILLVDDRPENLLALEAIIEREEYHLIKAQSGEEALKHLLKYDFAVILLDVQMPGMDGFSTAKIIKAREKTKNIPILFITANNMDSEHIFMGYSVGAIDYILKPFDPMILKSKVERFVEMYRLRQQLQAQTNALEEKNKVIEHMAFHDGLTGLPNRRMLNEQLVTNIHRAKAANKSLGILFIDLDRFKYVNDSLGHLMGDRILIEVSKRLSSIVREGDFVARAGGDEFIILLPNTDREGSLEVAENILHAFKAPFLINQYEFYITTSIGLAVFPYDGDDSNTIIKNADAALYRAKEQGKNKYKVFHTGMNIQSYRTFLMQNDLRKAIARNEFSLVYQPRVHIESGKVMSAEALLRWNHPEWGPVSPEEFIPIAEEMGLILEIDEWVLKSVCEQINRWKELGLPSMRIAINFSAQHFVQRNFIDQIQTILHDARIAPELIEIEITETAILGNEAIVSQTLTQIRQMGIMISLDDYGTGYSSLTYLKKFPFDTIKIDHSFIQDLASNENNSRVIVESIIWLARQLNMKVIAEGVERLDQLKLLTEFQCNEVQGYIYSKPLKPEDFIKFLSAYGEQRAAEQPKTNAAVEHTSKPKPDVEIGVNKDILKHAINQIKIENSLSNRELDVFRLIVDGLSNKEISEHLVISEHTVKNHITNILSKLNVSDRVHAIALVYETCIHQESIKN